MLHKLSLDANNGHIPLVSIGIDGKRANIAKIRHS